MASFLCYSWAFEIILPHLQNPPEALVNVGTFFCPLVKAQSVPMHLGQGLYGVRDGDSEVSNQLFIMLLGCRHGYALPILFRL